MIKKKESAKPVKKTEAPVAKKKVEQKAHSKWNPIVWGKKLVKFFREVYRELKKVPWATRKELFTFSGMVLGFTVLMGLITFCIDTGLTSLLGLIIK